MKSILLISSLICLVMVTGCTSLSQLSPYRTAKYKEEGPATPVVKVIGIWQPGEGQTPDHRPARGFAGQLMFFSPGIQKPIRVHGDVSIYVFDNEGDYENQVEPLSVFTFTDEEWNYFFHESKLGATYQVFIPYMKKGSHGADCSIRIKYEPKDGMKIYSQVARITLSGPRSSNSAIAKSPTVISDETDTRLTSMQANDRKIQQASHQMETFSSMIKNAGDQSSGQNDSMNRLKKILSNLEGEKENVENSYQVEYRKTLNGKLVDDEELEQYATNDEVVHSEYM